MSAISILFLYILLGQGHCRTACDRKNNYPTAISAGRFCYFEPKDTEYENRLIGPYPSDRNKILFRNIEVARSICSEDRASVLQYNDKIQDYLEITEALKAISMSMRVKNEFISYVDCFVIIVSINDHRLDCSRQAEISASNLALLLLTQPNKELVIRSHRFNDPLPNTRSGLICQQNVYGKREPVRVCDKKDQFPKAISAGGYCFFEPTRDNYEDSIMIRKATYFYYDWQVTREICKEYGYGSTVLRHNIDTSTSEIVQAIQDVRSSMRAGDFTFVDCFVVGALDHGDPKLDCTREAPHNAHTLSFLIGTHISYKRLFYQFPKSWRPGLICQQPVTVTTIMTTIMTTTVTTTVTTTLTTVVTEGETATNTTMTGTGITTKNISIILNTMVAVSILIFKA